MGRNLLSSIACLFRKRVHKAKKFVLSCEEGDFFVVECVKPGRYAVGRKMIICYGGEFYEGSDGLYWHSAKSKFMTNLYNEFRVGDFFGILFLFLYALFYIAYCRQVFLLLSF